MLTILRKLDWKYVISETAIVAIGVAMALTVDTWWQDRTDRVTELAYLKDMREEFAVTALDLGEEIESSVESMVAIDELLELMTISSLLEISTSLGVTPYGLRSRNGAPTS